MLTIFSTCKPFLGHSAVIQRNALKSWTLLHPDIEIILFGDDEGTWKLVLNLVSAMKLTSSGTDLVPTESTTCSSKCRKSRATTCFTPELRRHSLGLLADFCWAIDRLKAATPAAASWKFLVFTLGGRADIASHGNARSSMRTDARDLQNFLRNASVSRSHIQSVFRCPC